jgi:hypothetical protein
VEEMKNPNQALQPIEESLWLAHVIGLWTHAVKIKKQAFKGLNKTIDDAC